MTGIPYPLSVPDPQGRPCTWHPYAVRYRTADSICECHIYAVSEEHAAAIVDDLRDTSEVSGRVIGVEEA